MRLRRYYLRRLAEHTPDPMAASTAQLAAFLASSTWQPETRKSARATLVSFYAWAHEEGLVDVDPARRLPKVSVPRGRPRPAPERVVRNALGFADARVTLMVQLANLQGLRRGEIATLHTRDYDGESLRIRGKGGVVRVIPVHPIIADHLDGIKAVRPGWVFPGRGKRAGEHMTPGAVGKIVSRTLGPDWSAHALRHGAASRWYAVTRDMLAVRDLLGHASVATTQRYTATPPGAMQTAITGGTAA